MNKTELAGKIKLLEGLTEDEKSALLGLLHEQKKYGLVWEDKPEDVEQKLEDELPVLKEVKERAIISDDPSAPNHILIEGDNLHALTALTYTHQGKIDVIYIDPPYNTGNKDFIYNDSFVDKEDGYRHSKWLSFMSKRLEISKQLLSEKGVIFISIDDNEQAQLKLLCDQVFGENNFLSDIIWQHSIQPKGYLGSFSVHHNYTLAYKKTENFILGNLERTEEDNKAYKNPDKDPRGKWRSGDVRNALYRPNLMYDIITPSGNTIHAPEKGWRWSQETISEKIKTGEIIFNSDETNIIRKIYLETVDGRCPETIWFGKDVGTTREANSELKEIFDSKAPFDTPKPTRLVKRIITLANSQNAIILDFFAGSGTTLHSTMKLNDEDGGRRQCILVTNNENNICEKVTYLRNKKVIQGYTTPRGEEIEGLKNNTLRYYRTDFVPREQTNKNKRALMAAATDLLCIKNDVYTEQNTFGGRKLKPNAARYFDNGKTQMLLIYNELAVEAFASMLKEMEVEGKIKIYVFSNNRYAYNDNFENVLDKVELCALPAAIYDAYKKVLKPQKVKENVSQESISEEYVFEKTQGEIDFSEEGGEQ